jgi:ParB-like chromosome segregation protein Spo0J
MRDSTVLPDLRMLPTENLIPHEEVDPRRVERLCQRLQSERLLKNPPLVASIPDTERYVILDRANRTMALVAMGIPHVVAQVVDYQNPEIILDTWYHVVSGLDIQEFEDE